MATESASPAFFACRGRCAIVCLRFLSVCAVMAALVCGCEKDDDDSSDDSSGISTNPATQLLGVWIGPAGTDQNETTVELSSYHLGNLSPDELDHHPADCGTLRWANGDHRVIASAMYDPPVLKFYLMTGSAFSFYSESDTSYPWVWDATDIWELRYDGTSLSGEAEKLLGNHGWTVGHYRVFLTRRP